jgi:hypothetical protein
LMFIGESNFMTCGSGSQDTKGESWKSSLLWLTKFLQR